jgi:hypothetical protein
VARNVKRLLLCVAYMCVCGLWIYQESGSQFDRKLVIAKSVLLDLFLGSQP